MALDRVRDQLLAITILTLPTEQEAVWALKPTWTLCRKHVPMPGIKP